MVASYVEATDENTIYDDLLVLTATISAIVSIVLHETIGLVFSMFDNCALPINGRGNNTECREEKV
ncbi:hypothetical protein C9J48_18780 [Photobacterium profundum]|nr:hypothetical protein C9J48_18780 [Photobacterium profundum]